MTNTPTLTPRYGRDYKSKAKALADFEADKDFTFNDISSRWDGMACNRADLKAQGITSVKIRYAGLTKVIVADIS